MNKIISILSENSNIQAVIKLFMQHKVIKHEDPSMIRWLLVCLKRCLNSTVGKGNQATILHVLLKLEHHRVKPITVVKLEFSMKIFFMHYLMFLYLASFLSFLNLFDLLSDNRKIASLCFIGEAWVVICRKWLNCFVYCFLCLRFCDLIRS